MKYSVINQSTHVVENVVEWDGDSQWVPPDNTYLVPGYFHVGALYDPETNTATLPPEEPVVLPVPSSITRRQCAIELRERNQITPREALNMTRNGTPPAMVASLLSTFSEDQAILVETDFAADQYYRDNPLLNQLMQSAGATSEDIDNFFRSAALR